MRPDPIKRRVFIGSVARKALYVAPAAVALKAAQKTYAGPSGCGQTGSPCLDDPDCCGGFTCKRANSTPCIDMGMQGTMCTCEV
jgi:hypothetical protein